MNSPELISRLRTHGRDGRFEVAWVGEGWLDLVGRCHDLLEAAFPEYELLAIKQTFGLLEYQAFPRPWAAGEARWSNKEYGEVQRIVSDCRDRSERTCEWCGAVGLLRDWRSLVLTLCDECDARFPDPPYVLRGQTLSG